MISLLLAAALQSPSIVGSAGATAVPARYVRFTMRVRAYGIDGTGTIVTDRQTGRYAERIAAGPASLSLGFDGTRAWQSDSTGMSAMQGNATKRGVILALGRLLAFPQTATIDGATVRFADVPQPITFALDPGSGLIRRFVIFNGNRNQVATFSAFRSDAGGTVVPTRISFTDDSGTWTGRVTAVETPQTLDDAAFAPPAPPADATLDGITSVPFLVATEIIVPVRINDGPVMHFFFDTGGQNVIGSKSLKALGIAAVGSGTVGGAGAGVAPVKFAFVRSERIGTAELRNQPFLVLDSNVLGGVDGVVGWEILSRFATRIDYATNTLSLAPAMPASWTENATPVPFVFDETHPQISGSIDGFDGALTIDTGSSGVLDINAPFAHRNNLLAFYHAAKPSHGSLAGVGGVVLASNVTVRSFHLGTAALSNVAATITEASSGVEADPSVAANVGEGIFRNFTFVLDYPNQRLYFEPGGITDMSGILLGTTGHRIVVTKVVTNSARRAGVRTGATLTSLNGKPVTAADFDRVRASLQGPPGGNVLLAFDGKKPVKLTLLPYL